MGNFDNISNLENNYNKNLWEKGNGFKLSGTLVTGYDTNSHTKNPRSIEGNICLVHNPTRDDKIIEICLRSDTSRRDARGYGSEVFWVYFLDSEAAWSVVKTAWTTTFREITSHTSKLRTVQRFIEADLSEMRSKGLVPIHMSLLDWQLLYFSADMMEANIPLLVGIGILLYHGLILDFFTNKLSSGRFGWSLPIRDFKGHALVKYDEVSNILYVILANVFTFAFSNLYQENNTSGYVNLIPPWPHLKYANY